MLEYHVNAHRLDSHGSLVAAKEASLIADTDLAGRSDAFNPVELLLGALSACLLKGAERVLPVLGFDLRGIEVSLHAVRQDSPPKLLSIDYLITVDTDEPDNRIELLHTNIRKYGTISNTLALAVPIAGRIVRKA
ncbi:MAG: OsmC family protein [Verrucomicrobiota bacterium]|jgi:uncharacterized OsmC-like protein